MSKVDQNEFWMKYLTRTQLTDDGGFYMTATSSSDSNGLISAHAYSVLGFAVVNSKSGYQERLIHLHNPWGDTEWKGRWSDKDKASWTPQAKAQVGFVDRDDGMFWMSLSDFFRYYSRVSYCEIPPRHCNYQVLVGNMVDVSGKTPSPRNPQWRLTVKRDCTATIVTRAFDRDVNGRYIVSSVVLGTEVEEGPSFRAVSRTYSNYSVVVRQKFVAGKEYLLKPNVCERAKSPFNFTVRICADAKVTVDKVK